MAADSRIVNPEEGRVSPNVAFERVDIEARRIGLVAAGILVISLAAAVFVAYPFFAFKNSPQPESSRRSPEAAPGWREPPQPRLQASPELDLQRYTAGYNKALGTYSWADQSHGIAVIPLDRAMQIASRRGIPRTPVDPSIVLSQPRADAQSTGFQGKVLAPQ